MAAPWAGRESRDRGFLMRASSDRDRDRGRVGGLQEAGDDGTAGMRSRESDPDSANRLLGDRSDLEQSEP